MDFLFARGRFAGRNGAHRPKVAPLDRTLPKVAGVEVLERIRREQSTRLHPVVVVTSSKEEPDVRRCYERGVNSYIVKPVQCEAFVKAVTEAGI